MHDDDSLQLDPASSQDASILRELIAAFHEEDGHPIAPDTLARALAALAAAEPRLRVWLIRDAGEVVGYVALTLGYAIEVGGIDAYVDDLYVVPSERGRGVGRRALLFVEQAARALDVRRLCMEVEHHNTRARTLYVEHGFTDHARHLLSKWL